MMATFPFLPLSTDAYLSDTLHLTLEEHGAYLKILMISWRSPNGLMPDDDGRIATMLGITKARWQKKLRPALEPFFTIEGGFFSQKRLQSERKWVEEKRAKQSEAGKASALKRQETPSTDDGLANQQAGQQNGNPSTLPLPISKKVSKKDSPPIPPPRKNGAKITLPPEWSPNPKAFDIALEEGYDDKITFWLADQFRDSALANGRRYADWDRAFYTWVRNAKEFSKSLGSKPGSGDRSVLDAMDKLRREI